jgi:hypothetical protein
MDNVFDDEDQGLSALVTNHRAQARKTRGAKGFEPLTFCMPCTTDSSEAASLGLILAGQGVTAVCDRQAGSGGIWGRSHYVSHWSSGSPKPGEESAITGTKLILTTESLRLAHPRTLNLGTERGWLGDHW